MPKVSSLNQYKASFPDSTNLQVAAKSMSDALVALSEMHPKEEPSLLQKTYSGIAVLVPSPAIAIDTKVTVQGNEDGGTEHGCVATPYHIDLVENGDKVWFTAIPGEGYKFDGWYLDGTQKSTDESFEETVQYAGDVPVVLVYEAKFSVSGA